MRWFSFHTNYGTGQTVLFDVCLGFTSVRVDHAVAGRIFQKLLHVAVAADRVHKRWDRCHPYDHHDSRGVEKSEVVRCRTAIIRWLVLFFLSHASGAASRSRVPSSFSGSGMRGAVSPK
ncbi:hypothetical protein Y032_0189g1213 [Ancylostoma ceylanicum]|uniref:Uncharacterized protein n=1 Tax=Ancylostoma ceylanicum TaxID=53326 RepID=A0A016SQ97_9BILA|nr:hypothetical protein Y032_0189g1213 [Ancylostoma ceylanicum]